MDSSFTTQRDLAQYLSQAEAVILSRRLSEKAEPALLAPETKLRVGVDLGTAYLVLVVTDESGIPLAGEWQYAEVARDGLVVDQPDPPSLGQVHQSVTGEMLSPGVSGNAGADRLRVRNGSI